MNNYKESKKKIDTIRNKYGCSGDLLFRSAIQFLVQYGSATVLDAAWYKCTIDDIDANHNAAEKEGKNLFITREFEKTIVECARELAEINTYDLLIYIQKEIWLGDGISYQRAITLAKNSIAWLIEDTYETDYALQEAREIGFTDEEIEALGFEYLLEAEE